MKKLIFGIILVLSIGNAVDLDKVKIAVLEARFTSFAAAKAVGIDQDLANIKRWFTLAHQEILEYLELYNIGVLTKESFERLSAQTQAETMQRICSYIPYIEEDELPYLDYIVYYDIIVGNPKEEPSIVKFRWGKDALMIKCRL